MGLQGLEHANFDFLNALPVRPEALTFITWARLKYGVEVPHSLSFPLAFAVAALGAWKSRRTLGQITMAGVAAMTVFFVINKWAFTNYYFTLAGLASLAAAAALGDDAPEAAVSEPAQPR